MSDSEAKNQEIVKKKRGRKPKPKTELSPKIHKKRGRKPKPKTEEDIQKIPKKRGRKPKDKYKVEDKPNVINISTDENVILHLPINSIDIESKGLDTSNLFNYDPLIKEPEAFDKNNNHFLIDKNTDVNQNNYNNNELKLVIDYDDNANGEIKEINDIKNKYDNILNEYTENRNVNLSNNKIGKSKIKTLLYEYEISNKNKAWPVHSNINCLWDHHKFSNTPYGLPMKKIDNTVYMFGNFCSPQCAAAYNFNMKDDSDEIWERYSLLNWIYSDELEDPNDTFKLAPSPLSLKDNGGTMSIDEFRKSCRCNTKDYKVIHPPMISLVPTMEEINIDINRKKKYVPIDQEHLDKVDNEFKLKRTKPLPNYKNTLESCMSLKYV